VREMDAHQQQALWTITQEHYEAAELYAQRGWHTVCVAYSYYAVYTAMWVALGDAPHGQWSLRGSCSISHQDTGAIPKHRLSGQ
jgi:hypothetical protein